MTDSKEKKELSSLLKNIQKGLRAYDIKDLNDALVSLLDKKSGKNESIETVLECVCQEFDINLKQLLTSTKREITQVIRPVTVCLLHFNQKLSVRKISRSVFRKEWHTFVREAIKRHKEVDENHKQDKEYIDRYRRIEDAVNKKLNK